MRRRRGSLLIELSATIVVLATASTLLVSYLQAVAAQKRQLEQYTVAHQAAANLLERELERPYAELANQPSLELWPEAQALLFEVRAESAVTDIAAQDGQPAGKQVAITVSWGKEPGHAARLIGWRFSSAEDTE